MAVQVSYPGVYIQELSSGVHTISGVATSITAFVGYTVRGIDNKAGHLFSWPDFERQFGGLDSESELSYAVQQFFNNGGTEAYVVRVPKNGSVAATVNLYSADKKWSVTLAAISKGEWGNRVVADVSYDGIDAAETAGFNLVITDRTTGAQETFWDVSADATASNYFVKVINDPDSGSELVVASDPKATGVRPAETGTVGGTLDFTKIDSKKVYDLKIAADLPAALNTALNVPVLAAGDPVPTSALGLARLLERKINAALAKAASPATVRCVTNAKGDGLRIYADFDPNVVPNANFDAVLTFTDGATTSLLPALNLTGSTNVGHYLLGLGRKAGFQNDPDAPAAGDDGKDLPHTDDLIGDAGAYTGLYALDKVDLFNILCIPDATRAKASDPGTLDPNVDPNSIYAQALSFFLTSNRRAFLLVDPPPEVSNVDKATDWKTSGLKAHDKNAAAYFPRLRLPDPLNNYSLRTFAPCGVIAGLYARIDGTRGVWKAPAGVEATLNGVQGQVYTLNDLENGSLNKLGLNCSRTFPIYGNISWGARTLVGSDDEASEWKYVPVRRTAQYIEESLFRGLKWVVFEPNDEKLWAQIRLNVQAFMHDLFRQGAFQGTTPTQAYLVKCDSDTTTRTDINNGIVNILVGFAPLKPAEFVVLTLQQLAGQIQT